MLHYPKLTSACICVALQNSAAQMSDFTLPKSAMAGAYCYPLIGKRCSNGASLHHPTYWATRLDSKRYLIDAFSIVWRNIGQNKSAALLPSFLTLLIIALNERPNCINKNLKQYIMFCLASGAFPPAPSPPGFIELLLVDSWGRWVSKISFEKL